jgi:glyoxylase-like metal-dependent hydrolase (beta-lactamase superfamily II)
LQRTTLGDFELTIVNDGGYYLDGGAMFGVVPKVLWEKKFPPDEKNRLHMECNTLVVRTGDRTVLIETGIGNKLSEKLQGIYSNKARLLANLEASNIAPDDIDIVINTHLHFDHAGWNTIYKDGRPVPTFPRAKYYAQRGEWEHAQEQHERDRISYISDNYNPLIDSGQMELISGDREICPGISVRVLGGHTRHHQSVILRSAGKTACYIGDLVPTVSHLHPTWVMGYDLDPILCIDNRHKLYAEAVPEQWLCIFTHEPRTPMAYISKNEKGSLIANPVGTTF